jgi:hypothetical protein
MKRSTILALLLILPAGAGLALAQTEESTGPSRHGVDRASAAGKPNEAGALPESSYTRQSPDGAQDTAYPATTAAAEPATPSLREEAPALEARALPATASPLASLTVSGLIFLAAAGGLYRMSREPQH